MVFFMLLLKLNYINLNLIFFIFNTSIILPNIFNSEDLLTIFILVEIFSYSTLLLFIDNKRKDSNYNNIFNLFYFFFFLSFLTSLFFIISLYFIIYNIESTGFKDIIVFFNINKSIDFFFINFFFLSFYLKLGFLFFHLFKVEYYKYIEIKNIFTYSSYIVGIVFFVLLHINLMLDLNKFIIIKYFLFISFLLGFIFFIIFFFKKKNINYLLAYSSISTITILLLLIL